MEDARSLPERIVDSLPDWLGANARQWNRRVAKPVALSVAGARSGLFFAESVPLLALQRLLGNSYEPSITPPREAREAVLDALREITTRDAENIARGIYPLSVLAPVSSPLEHASRYLRLLADSIGVAARRRDRKPREFAGDAARFAAELPAYYRRNFHFQTDGYLSESSAELYEHQVEILFRGVADAMRRMVIPPIKKQFRNKRGRGLRFLELGAGCGTATRFVAQAFPDAQITCVDLSHPYLNAAQKRLSDFDRIDFMQGDAADLDLRDERFDAVYSVFLFHELPMKQRERVLAEARRVTKRGGLHVLVDALQQGDVPDLDWALEEFPRKFHEPYFRNYTRHPMEPLFEAAGFAPPDTSAAFLSKIVSGGRA